MHLRLLSWLLLLPTVLAQGQIPLEVDPAADQCPCPTSHDLTVLLAQQCPVYLESPRDKPRTPTQEGARNHTTSPHPANDSATGSTVTTASIPAGPSLTRTKAAENQSAPDAELDADSPLDSPQFQSFEEWRKANLERSGQSDGHAPVHRSEASQNTRKRPGVNINALDSLGDESEIEIEFSGFGPGALPQDPVVASQKAEAGPDTVSVESGLGTRRPLPRDAGKTCKERFNYASFDCAAQILKTNSKCKSASSILVESKDSYLRNDCQIQNKFFIVELCDLIFVDTIVLANYEFFSSTFKAFTVSVSDRYPVKLDKWKKLGTYEARNTRAMQAFLVEDPLIWARYIRVELHTHYGAEYYCPVSLFRVHGTTMVEEFRRENEALAGYVGQDDEDPPINEADVGQPQLQEAAIIQPVVETSQLSEAPIPFATGRVPPVVIEAASEPVATALDTPRTSTNTMNALLVFSKSASTCPSGSAVTTTISPVSPPSPPSVPQGSDLTKSDIGTVPGRGIAVTVTEGITSISSSAVAEAPPSDPVTLSSMVESNASVKPASATKRPSDKPAIGRPPVAYPPIPPGQMGAQESFFKNIHRRLQQLEANATLSLQYIEEQSRLLRDAFTKVEKRQLNKTTRFLDGLNETVVKELSEFRGQYTHLWLTAVNELQQQRELSLLESSAISARMAMLADEIITQRRWAYAQSSLVILAIFLSLFARSSDGQLIKTMLTRPKFGSPAGSGQVATLRRTARHPMHELRDRIVNVWPYQSHRRHGSAPEIITHPPSEDPSSASEGETSPVELPARSDGAEGEGYEDASTWNTNGAGKGREVPLSPLKEPPNGRIYPEHNLRPGALSSGLKSGTRRLASSPLRYSELASDEDGRESEASSPERARNEGWSSFSAADGYFTPHDFYPSISTQSMRSLSEAAEIRKEASFYGEPGSSDADVDEHTGLDSPEAPSPIERPRSADV